MAGLGVDQLALSRHLSVASRFNIPLDTAMSLKGDSKMCKVICTKAFCTAVPVFSPETVAVAGNFA